MAVVDSEKAFERIQVDPRVGIPIIRDLRTPVTTIVSMVDGGRTTGQILHDFPARGAGPGLASSW
jgi:uncharacterized protein (DUF433 family)